METRIRKSRTLGRLATAPPFFDNAACKNSDPDIWFPTTFQESGRAIAVCQNCPVRQECLDWALAQRNPKVEYGVWGGKLFQKFRADR